MKVRLNTRKKQYYQNKRVLGRSIEERPAEVNDRQEFDRLEIDTVIGKKSNDQTLLTITEREDTQGDHYKGRCKGCTVHQWCHFVLEEGLWWAISESLQKHHCWQRVRICQLATVLKKRTEVYFTHPYTSSERETNERQNGLIRRFIPKGNPFRPDHRLCEKLVQPPFKEDPRIEDTGWILQGGAGPVGLLNSSARVSLLSV